MKNLYILNSIYSSVNFTFEVDTIISDSKVNDVTVLQCDGCIGKCAGNTLGIKLLCRACRKRTTAVLDSIPNIRVIKTGCLMGSKKKHQKYEFDSLKELNKIEYKGFEIGYGISSYYISLTRNLNPLITPKLRRILDDWLECSMKYADIADKLVTTEYDKMYIVNGRLFDSKPFQEIAFARGVYVLLGESYTSIDGQVVRMNFDNVRVHSVKGNCDNIRTFWDSSKIPIEERRKIAASFYEKRANSIKTDDKIYTAGQQKGLMPNDWDNNKVNIGIFNSSEDEFAAIGGEFEKNNLFDSQMSGIRFLLENVKDPSIHFYLRIHPNLMNIPYKYHKDLYKLPEEFSNITVIPGNSPVSSYSLMQACDRVITFGSTMGVESAYAGKTSMVMRPCFYYYLHVNFVPKTKEEVLDFVYGKIPYTPDKEDALKYSYYYYNDERGTTDNKECQMHRRAVSFGRRKFFVDCMNLCCSEIEMKLFTYLTIMGIAFAKNRIPKEEK